MARVKRKWWQKKTNVGLFTFLVGAALAMFPPTSIVGLGVTIGAISKFVAVVGGALTAHGIADRAGKENEEN